MRNNLIKSALSAGLESETTDMEAVGVIDHAAEIASKAIEVEELFNEVAATSAEVDRLETAANALDRIVEESQGELLTQDDIPLVNIAIENIGRSLGVESISLESIHETLARVWEDIKAFIKKLVTLIKNFFASIFGGFKSLKARSDRLRKSAEEAKEDASGTLKHSAFLNRLSFGMSTDPVAILKGLDKTEEVVHQSFIEVKRCAAGIAVGMAKAGAVLAEGGDVEGIPVEFENEYKSGVFSGGGEIVPDNAGTKYSIFFRVITEDPRIGTLAAKHHNVAKPSRVQIKQVSKHVFTLCDVVLSKQEIINNITKVYNEIITKTDVLMREKDKRILARTLSLRHHNYVGKLAMSNYSKTLSEVSKVAFNIGRAALQYGEASLP